MKKHAFVFLAALAVVLAGAAQPAAAVGPGLTMVVMPARYSVLQVGFDLFNRFPVVLVSYQGDATTESPLIHAWNGEEWVKVSQEDYASAAFLQETPGRVILVGDEKLLPPAMGGAAAWCPRVETVADIDTAALVNALAKPLSFSQADWKWFAKRYNLDLEDHNAARRTTSWYDRPAYEDEWTPKLRRGRAAPIAPAVESSEAMPVVEPQAPAGEPTVEPPPEPAPAPVQVEEPVVEVAPIEAAPLQPWEEKAVETEAPVK